MNTNYDLLDLNINRELISFDCDIEKARKEATQQEIEMQAQAGSLFYAGDFKSRADAYKFLCKHCAND